MDFNRRVPVVASKTITVLIVLALVVAGSGCTQVVSGTARMAMPKIGGPIDWQPCHFKSSDTDAKIPSGSMCGRLGVPIDYSNPGAGTASMNLIKFPATGTKIGSLLINPGGPGESGISAAVW